jgi:hypothetical protein
MFGIDDLLIGSLIGTGINAIGGIIQGNAQQDIAQQQYRASQEAIAQQRREREQALGFAAPSSTELDAKSQMLQLQQQVLGRAQNELQFLQRGLDLTHPGASEQGAGLFSSILARTRANQRDQLAMQLSERLGPGYATTSAGQDALRQFDVGTADVAAQAIPQFLSTAYQAIQAPVTLEDALKRRQIAAASGTPVAPMMFQGSQFAGAGSVGGALMGQALGQFGSNIANLGGQAMGYKMMSDRLSSFMRPSGGGTAPIIEGPMGGTNYQTGQSTLPQWWSDKGSFSSGLTDEQLLGARMFNSAPF